MSYPRRVESALDRTRYQLVQRLEQYLLFCLTGRSETTIHYRLKHRQPVLSIESIRWLERYRPTGPFTLVNLRHPGHFQLLYIDNRTRTFTILDPNWSTGHWLVAQLNQLIETRLGYRALDLDCPRGPQAITQGGYCGAWTLLMALLITQTDQGPEQVYRILADQSPEQLETLVTGFTNYLYDWLAKTEPVVLRKAQRIQQLITEWVEKGAWNMGASDAQTLTDWFNRAAIQGQADDFNLYSAKEDLGIEPNHTYLILKRTQLSQLAKLFLAKASQWITDSDHIRIFYTWLLQIPPLGARPRG